MTPASTTQRVRPAAVAGTFYPADPVPLQAEIDRAFAAALAPQRGADEPAPLALVVPHAGYVFSGPVAASAYRQLRSGDVHRVVLLGPSHFVPLPGLGVSGADAFETPTGLIPVDAAGRVAALEFAHTDVDDAAHETEHSLEVQLPFLTVVLGDYTVLPIAVGRADPVAVADVVNVFLGAPDTVVVVSTDLSHYDDYATATARDRHTADAVLAADHDAIAGNDACGAAALRGLLLAVHRRGLQVSLLDLRNSGDIAGDHRRVVGYGAFAVR